MSEKEKRILDTFGKAIPKMTEAEKERLLMCGELINMICDKPKRRKPKLDTVQKGA